MCVGLQAKVVSVKNGVALVDALGAKRSVSAELIDSLEPGDYVMVHAGSAIAKITDTDENEAEDLLSGIFDNESEAK
ncbi:HypC/HybG/HupF family hydrogenase formation chaperone [Lachnospiraceae bacterium C1.1]|nr:HypC/HybG/HupF family hydrogenase formation chaperone [Lachnospiraceae bacterium C1.1]